MTESAATILEGDRSDPETLRTAIRDLHAKHRRGDLRDKDFQKAVAERVVDLYRAEISRRLESEESIVAEHHVVSAHLRLNQSLLRETDQQATSLFATERRLIRLRSVLASGRPATCDVQDGTILDEVPLDRLRGITVRREVRVGEALAGLSIMVFALLFRSWLLVTGTLMFLLGALGTAHSLLLPTRWLEVQSSDDQTRDEPFRILAARRRSGRALVRYLRQSMTRGGEHAA